MQDLSFKSPSLARGLINFRANEVGCVATIGSFDGVHRGHQAILQQVTALARAKGLPAIAIVFEPQPQEYFLGDKAPARLTPLREKFCALLASGIDQVVCLAFNEKLRHLTADAFVREILVKHLKVRHLVVGDDFRFGCDRRGDFSLLSELGAELNFSVIDTCTFEVDGERVSSTRIRTALDESDFTLASALLGAPFRIAGKIAYGQQLGRKLGVPTANVRLRRYRSPLHGVFAVTATFADGETYQGVANIGNRPTVNGDKKPLLEVHLFDFSKSVYGAMLSVEFHVKLRDEQKFNSLDQLQQQLQQDITDARTYFAGATTF